MTKTPKPEPDDKEQSSRFVQTAKELEVDENREAFERLFGAIARPKQTDQKPPGKSSTSKDK